MVSALPPLSWQDPFWLWLLPAAPLLIAMEIWFTSRAETGIRFSNWRILGQIGARHHAWLYYLRLFVLGLSWVGLILALARPQWLLPGEAPTTKFLDIMLALDLSESMRANDLRPNRLAVAKKVLRQFVLEHPYDRVGLTVFSGASVVAVPLTFDHAALLSRLEELSTNTLGLEGTAMGEAMFTAAKALLQARRANQADLRLGSVLVLTTDGDNNRGTPPGSAAAILVRESIHFYLIGLGGRARIPRFEYDPLGRRIPLTDPYGAQQYWEPMGEPLMREIARSGQGRYFQAADAAAYQAALFEMSRIEKKSGRKSEPGPVEELFFYPLGMTLLCWGLVLLMRIAMRDHIW
jgi:Ca-activated chloride channel family protein